jgi:hypothetical protein
VIAAGAAIARLSILMAQSYPGIIEAMDIAEAGFISLQIMIATPLIAARQPHQRKRCWDYMVVGGRGSNSVRHTS